MDPFALLFYAGVCGCLSVAAPRLGGRFQRLAIGAGVGMVAAALLPIVRQFITGSTGSTGS
jgi:hypothetical protein